MSLPEPPTVPRCYRHPDREGGRSCTRCGKPACADCLVQAAVGSHCLDCAKAARPDVKSRAQIFASKQMTPVTLVLMGINIFVFLWMFMKDRSAGGQSITRLHADLALSIYPLRLSNEWYRLVTSGFVHFGILHLAFNMYALYQLGQLLERALSTLEYTLLYFAGLLAGSAGVLLVEGTHIGLTAGASGAIFGLLGAAAIGMHRRGINIFTTGIGTALMLNLFITFSLSGISIGGHLGGLVGGAACGYFMLAPAWKRYPKWVNIVVPVGVIVAAVALSVLYVKSVSFPI